MLPTLGDREIEAFEEEYAVLFLTGGVTAACPLNESAYVDPSGRNRGLVAAAVERAYAQAGMALAPAADGELPDHAGLELEFLAQLCGEEAEAWRARAAEQAFELLETQRRFLDGHLLLWFPSLVRRVDDAADPGSLYREAAQAAHAFLFHDRDLISLLLEAQRARAATAE